MEVVRGTLPGIGFGYVKVSLKEGESFSFLSPLKTPGVHPGATILPKGLIEIRNSLRASIKVSASPSLVGGGWLLPGRYEIVAETEAEFVCIEPLSAYEKGSETFPYPAELLVLKKGDSVSLGQNQTGRALVCLSGSFQTSEGGLTEFTCMEVRPRNRVLYVESLQETSWAVLLGQPITQPLNLPKARDE